MKAKYDGNCCTCAKRFFAGDEIVRVSMHGYAHQVCVVKAELPKCNKCGGELALGFKARGLCASCEVSTDAAYRASNLLGWTQDEIRSGLRFDNQFVERAVSALFERQVTDEQMEEQTKHLNHVGFSAADAKRLSVSAKWFRSGRHIDGWFLEETRRRLLKYTRQLADIANEKRAAKAKARAGRDETGEPIKADDFNARWIEWKNRYAAIETERERASFVAGL